MSDTSSGSDIIDVRDVIERFEELEEDETGENEDELEELKELLDDLAGNGGDVQWRGDWYPITLISDYHFQSYAQELAEDIGAINSDATWPNNCIDWEKAARQLQMDYTTVEYGGVTYHYR